MVANKYHFNNGAKMVQSIMRYLFITQSKSYIITAPNVYEAIGMFSLYSGESILRVMDMSGNILIDEEPVKQ